MQDKAPPESATSRNPRQIGEVSSRGGPNRFEPTPEQIPGNPEPRGVDYRAHPLPQAKLPAVPDR